MKFNIIKIPTLDSTNNYAQNLVNQGKLHEGDVITTLFQKAGKGQEKNKWESEDGSNLLISLILEPKNIAASDQFVLTQLVSLAISKLISEQILSVENKARIKWPNDIYVDDKKIAGVLFQNSIMGDKIKYSIIGIGINVNQQKFYSDAPNPISIINFTKKKTDITQLMLELLENINTYYNRYNKNENFEELKQKYLNRLYNYKTWANYTRNGIKFIGKIIDVDQYGRLIIELENKSTEKFMFKEISIIHE